MAPMYVKGHSYGEYVFDHSWAHAMERAGGRYYPKLLVASPFSPVPGPRLLRAADAEVDVASMAGALRQACEVLDLSSVHINFCQADEWEALGSAGWLQRLGMQFHWTNDGYTDFDSFLVALNSRKRKSIRRERRDAQAAGLDFLSLRGHEIKKEDWRAFYQFYLSTVDRKWGSAYLTERFFQMLSDRLGDRVVLMLARRGSEAVAGALNLIGRDALYGRNWGCLGDWPFLHFELCYYRAIDFAISEGLSRVEAGAQGEHKIQRGYLPVPDLLGALDQASGSPAGGRPSSGGRETGMSGGNRGSFSAFRPSGKANHDGDSPRGRRCAKGDMTMSEQAKKTDERVRLRAYHLWERDGRPHGRNEEYWERALAADPGRRRGREPTTSSTRLNRQPVANTALSRLLISSRNASVVSHCCSGPISVARSFVMKPASTVSMQTRSSVSANVTTSDVSSKRPR